jgi:hypothetical protein
MNWRALLMGFAAIGLLSAGASAQSQAVAQLGVMIAVAVADAPSKLVDAQGRVVESVSSEWSDWDGGVRVRATLPRQVEIGSLMPVSVKLQADGSKLRPNETELPKSFHWYLRVLAIQSGREHQPELVCGYQDWMDSELNIETEPAAPSRGVRTLTYSDTVQTAVIDHTAQAGAVQLLVQLDWGWDRERQEMRARNAGTDVSLGKTWRGVLSSRPIEIELLEQPKVSNVFHAPTKIRIGNTGMAYSKDDSVRVEVQVPKGRLVFHSWSVDSRPIAIIGGFPRPEADGSGDVPRAGAQSMELKVFTIQVFRGSKSVWGPERKEDLLWSRMVPAK